MNKQHCESLLQRASGALADARGMVDAGRPVTSLEVRSCAVSTVQLLTEFNLSIVNAGLVRREPELVARAQWLNNRLADLRIPL